MSEWFVYLKEKVCWVINCQSRIRKWCDELDDASELQAVYCMQGREKGKELSMSSMNVAGKDIFGSYFSEIVVIVKGQNCMKAMRAFL